MDGKKKLEELVAAAGNSAGWHGNPMVSPDTIRSISDAYKAMEAENERLRRAVEFTAKMCWRTDPPHAVNALSVVDRLSAIKFHPTIKKYGEPHEQLRVAESEARHEG